MFVYDLGVVFVGFVWRMALWGGDHVVVWLFVGAECFVSDCSLVWWGFGCLVGVGFVGFRRWLISSWFFIVWATGLCVCLFVVEFLVVGVACVVATTKKKTNTAL